MTSLTKPFLFLILFVVRHTFYCIRFFSDNIHPFLYFSLHFFPFFLPSKYSPRINVVISVYFPSVFLPFASYTLRLDSFIYLPLFSAYFFPLSASHSLRDTHYLPSSSAFPATFLFYTPAWPISLFPLFSFMLVPLFCLLYAPLPSINSNVTHLFVSVRSRYSVTFFTSICSGGNH